jgi:hypothetical protein
MADTENPTPPAPDAAAPQPAPDAAPKFPIPAQPMLAQSPQPWIGLDMRSADVVIDLFEKAAHANLHSALRKGATVHLPAHGRVLMTGDIHDHGPNLTKILKLAAIADAPTNHVILHEVIHGESFINGMDLSVRILAKVAALKAAFPDQVHLLQSNHELAQFKGEGILKGNVSVCEVFDQGVNYIYADRADDVRAALRKFIRSYPLAVRAPKGILFIHSLPAERQLEKFDPSVLDRDPSDADLEAGGSGYMLCWGRYQSQDLCDKLAEKWGVNLFITGHQPAEMGYEMMTRSLMILASNHEHGMVLPIDLSKRYDMDKAVESLVPLAAVSA